MFLNFDVTTFLNFGIAFAYMLLRNTLLSTLVRFITYEFYSTRFVSFICTLMNILLFFEDSIESSTFLY